MTIVYFVREWGNFRAEYFVTPRNEIMSRPNEANAVVDNAKILEEARAIAKGRTPITEGVNFPRAMTFEYSSSNMKSLHRFMFPKANDPQKSIEEILTQLK